MSQILFLRNAQYVRRIVFNKIIGCSYHGKVRERNDGNSSLQVGSQENRSSQLSNDVRPLGEKIKETTKTASYTAVILAGIGVTAVMLWAIFRELFSSTSPNNIYSDALERVKEVNIATIERNNKES